MVGFQYTLVMIINGEKNRNKEEIKMIKKENKMGEILKMSPEAGDILRSFGMGCLGCPSATMETLEDACLVHGLNLDEVLDKLNSEA